MVMGTPADAREASEVSLYMDFVLIVVSAPNLWIVRNDSNGIFGSLTT